MSLQGAVVEAASSEGDVREILRQHRDLRWSAGLVAEGIEPAGEVPPLSTQPWTWGTDLDHSWGKLMDRSVAFPKNADHTDDPRPTNHIELEPHLLGFPNCSADRRMDAGSDITA